MRKQSLMLWAGILGMTLPAHAGATLPCVGSCGAEREVTADSLVTLVNIAQGSLSLDACASSDANGDGDISIDEIVVAVNNALTGCPERFLVSKTDDTADGYCDDDCSLREAFVAANTHPGPDEIAIPAGVYVLTRTGNEEDSAATGDLDITEDVSIEGTGAATTVLDGNGTDRVIDILAGAVTIERLTIRNGHASHGGGMRVGDRSMANPTLLMSAVTLAGNTAGTGGAIRAFSLGSLTLRGCTLRNNAATVSGGALLYSNVSTLENCTISGNSGNMGGGLAISGGHIRNCTIVGNVTLESRFASSNLARFSDVNRPGVIVVENTIVGGSEGRNCGSAEPEGGGNLSDDSSCGRPGDTNWTVVPDLGIAPLTDTGDGIPVHPLCTGVGVPDPSCAGPSPALGAADSGACPSTDQRGFPRSDPWCDSGAYEAE
ncbi:CSLREA domain-containing protein [Candidatus Binatia bacterium]|nr:CSLREA domain-containing protein [Candidatus Binatia bacterium]